MEDLIAAVSAVLNIMHFGKMRQLFNYRYVLIMGCICVCPGNGVCPDNAYPDDGVCPDDLIMNCMSYLWRMS